MAAIAAGVGLAVAGGGIQAFFADRASRRQVAAAEREAERARQTGREARGIIAGAEGRARGELTAGFDEGQSLLSQSGRVLSDREAANRELFAQQRDVGGRAFSRLDDVILGGDISQLQLDPGFEFRRQEGESAIARQAAAAGSFGSGANLRDFSSFNQGLASQEFGAALQRLAGLASVGQSATSQLAQLNTTLAGGRSNILGTQATFAAQEGGALAQLTQSSAANQANSLLGQESAVSNFNIQAANAQANRDIQFGNIAGDTFQSVGTAFGLAAPGQAPAAPAAVPQTHSSIQTGVPRVL